MTPVTSRAESAPRTADPSRALPAEAAAMAGRLSAADIHYTRRRARRLDVGVDEVLLASGVASADELARGAARTLGVGFEPLGAGPATSPSRLHDDDMAAMLRTGLMRRADGRLVVAARGLALRRFATDLARDPRLRQRVALTSPERLAALVRRRFEVQLGWRAAYRLRERRPDLSAGTLGASRSGFALGILALAALFLIVSATSIVGTWVMAVLFSLVLLGGAILQLTACTLAPQAPTAPLRRDHALPYYTLIVPLYREARVVPQLLDALAALDYPREKLQVLLVIEPDDAATAAALAPHAGRPGFEVIVAPDAGPRTKPKAMNAALPFARGTIIGIYDAEDMPEPLQLREACAVFQRDGGERIGCVQARLAIDNLADGWITRQFAAEYAAYFDVMLPMLGAYGLPLPLGGTSNHFRREALEGVGAWDPFNVTEDADLGVRLAAAGWRTAVIASTTDEEAPRRLPAWMRQRTRWYKGWMQTLLVHSRHPRRLVQGTGLPGAVVLALLLGGGLTAALLHPFLGFVLLLDLWRPPEAIPSRATQFLDAVWPCVLLAGYGSAALSTAIGMRRRQVPGIARVLALMPVYWLMLSAAAWRALFQLIVAPHRWEKTEHGLARTSRRRPRLLRRIAVRGSGAGPRRPRRAGA
ncbi:glycosyltransferase [Ancylobacter moscoviensis]